MTLVLEHLPDGPVIEALRARRGRGRDDYPVEAMWRALVAGVVFQHVSIESLLRELKRNPGLLAACGFNPLPLQEKPRRAMRAHPETGAATVVSMPSPRREPVPNAWNFSRFLHRVEAAESETGCVTGMVGTLRGRLMEVLPDFGVHLGYDGKAIESHSTGRTNRETGRTSDPDADWGKHETHGVDRKTGRAWTKVKSWFGYGLHLIADTQYEIPVAFEVTKASASESAVLSEAIGKLLAEDRALAGRGADFSADRGLDSAALKKTLWDEHGIRPLIDTRRLWREEKAMPDYDPSKPILRALYPERVDTVMHSEQGEVICRCPATGTERPMAFQGFEAGRGTLKYRCPAAAYDLKCKGRTSCYRGVGCRAGDYGRVVRIDLATHDRRIFTPTPHGSPSWRRGLQATRRPGADQQPPGREFRLRAPLHPGPSGHEDPRGFGTGDHDGAGAGACAGGPPRPNAVPGESGPVPGHRIAPPRHLDARRIDPRPPGRGRPCPFGGPKRESFSLGRNVRPQRLFGRLAAIAMRHLRPNSPRRQQRNSQRNSLQRKSLV